MLLGLSFVWLLGVSVVVIRRLCETVLFGYLFHLLYFFVSCNILIFAIFHCMLSGIKIFHPVAFLGSGGKRWKYFIVALLLFTRRFRHDSYEHIHGITDSTDHYHHCIHHPGAGRCDWQRSVLCRHPRQPLHENTHELSYSKPCRSGHHCGSVCRAPLYSDPRLQAPGRPPGIADLQSVHWQQFQLAGGLSVRVFFGGHFSWAILCHPSPLRQPQADDEEA